MDKNSFTVTNAIHMTYCLTVNLFLYLDYKLYLWLKYDAWQKCFLSQGGSTVSVLQIHPDRRGRDASKLPLTVLSWGGVVPEKTFGTVWRQV